MTRTLTDADINYAARRRDAALWYAHGMIDGMADDIDSARVDQLRRGAALLDYSRPEGPASTFAELARREAIAYRSEEVSSLASITDQWSRFYSDAMGAGCTPPVIPDPDPAAVAFFREHAGSSFNPATETAEEGRERGAIALAIAEARAAADGLDVTWSDDWELSPDGHCREFDCYDDGPPTTCELACLIDPESPGDVLDALGCIDDATPEYRRVIAAELAASYFHAVDAARAA